MTTIQSLYTPNLVSSYEALQESLDASIHAPPPDSGWAEPLEPGQSVHISGGYMATEMHLLALECLAEAEPAWPGA